MLAAIECSVGAIQLFDEAGKALHLVSQRGICPQAVAEFECLPLEGTLAGWVVAHAEPLVTPDLAVRTPHLAQISGLRSYIGVPMRARGQIVGVLSVLARVRKTPSTLNRWRC